MCIIFLNNVSTALKGSYCSAFFTYKSSLSGKRKLRALSFQSENSDDSDLNNLLRHNYDILVIGFAHNCFSYFKEYPQQKTEESVMEKRKRLISTICNRTGLISGKFTEVSGLKDKNLSYCMVQKAGCTIYVRLFKFLNGQNRHTGTPLSIGKYEVHNTEGSLYKTFTKDDNDFIMTSLRAMTVRNPYTRLWSAYIDKLLLPDFWLSKGRQIVKFSQKKPSEKSSRCGYDVTFPEFIKYVLFTGHSMAYINQDKHLLPASDICDPCAFKPEIINKQETFVKDLKYTLSMSNLTNMIQKVIPDDPTEFEIRDEIDYNFKIHQEHKTCIDKYGLSKLIWIALAFNGYIPATETFPSDIYEESLNAELLYEVVKSVREKHKMTREYNKSARKLALRKAYSQISTSDMERLKQLYKYDFEMFGYASTPDFL